MQFRHAIAAILIWLGSAAAVFGQGVQTGTIRGVVRDQQSLPVPGVTVTVVSQALLGPRVQVTDAGGAFAFATLPPGEYDVTYELSGFETTRQRTVVPLGLAVELSATLNTAGLIEQVVVVAETPAPIATAIVGADFKHAEVESLAMPRTLAGIAELSPGLTNVTPNANQVSINGAFAFDNVFMINGVDVNDNLFGTPQNLFIEEAIQETQTLTSGISAEYGRFSGGVVNAISKSGGNTVSGSFRDELTNPSWSTETPFEVQNDTTHSDVLNKHYEATLGGPIQKDRLWFFAAGRFEDLSTSSSLPETGIANTRLDRDRRGEIKVTASVWQSHTVQAGYVNNHVENSSRPTFPFSIDPFTAGNRTLANSYVFANYRGAVNRRTLVQLQYPQRTFGFENAGGTSTAIVDSPFITLGTGRHYNAQYFDASDPEDRNNRQLTASLTRYWERAGRHEIKGGYEFFRSQRRGGNSQSATDYVFDADYLSDAAGKPVFDTTGHLIPLFVPGKTQIEHWIPVRGAVLNVDTNSLYAQDHWAVNGHVSADLGVRFERVRSEATGGIIGVDTNALVPRLAAAYDLRGDGKYVAHVSYGHYAGRYNEAQIGGNNNVGNPDVILGTYQGPAGQGRTFAPGLNPANYTVDNGVFPTANVSLAPGLSAPITKEFSASFGSGLGTRGYAEATYVLRRTGDIIEDFIDTANGATRVVKNGTDFGRFTNVVFDNTDVARRAYQALLFQGRYRMSSRWSVNGHFTLMLQDEGNYEGEAANQPGLTAAIGDFPEIFNDPRHFPTGRLQDFQRHKLRLWTVYAFDMGHGGDLAVSGLWRVNSGQVFSLRAINQPLTETQERLLAAAGYPDAPARQTAYFGGRGTEEFPGYGLFDASVNYNIPVFRSLRPWAKFDVFNVFDNLKLVAWNRTVLQDPDSPKDDLGLATGYLRGPLFGQADSNVDFPASLPGVIGGRTFRVAFGFRF